MGWPQTHKWQLSTRWDSDYRGPPEGSRGPSPTEGLPSPGFLCLEEEFPQNVTVKIGEDSKRSDESEGT